MPLPAPPDPPARTPRRADPPTRSSPDRRRDGRQPRRPTTGPSTPSPRGPPARSGRRVGEPDDIAPPAPRDRAPVSSRRAPSGSSRTSGMNDSASIRPMIRSGSASRDSKTGRSESAGAPRSTRRRGRRSGSVRMSLTSTRSRIRAGRRSRHRSSNRYTSTTRSASSTCSPARASAYARRPPTLTAEYAGGRWRTEPSEAPGRPTGPRRSRRSPLRGRRWSKRRRTAHVAS